MESHPAMSELTEGYGTVRGSDVQRDGMFLELTDARTGKVVAEVFYSDSTNQMTLSLFQQDLPVDVVELLIAKAKRELPPVASL